MEPLFTSATVWSAEGARVGLVTCTRCGAAVLLDPRDTFQPQVRHREWHEENDQQ